MNYTTINNLNYNNYSQNNLLSQLDIAMATAYINEKGAI